MNLKCHKQVTVGFFSFDNALSNPINCLLVSLEHFNNKLLTTNSTKAEILVVLLSAEKEVYFTKELRFLTAANPSDTRQDMAQLSLFTSKQSLRNE